jgi:hypothetical protein
LLAQAGESPERSAGRMAVDYGGRTRDLDAGQAGASLQLDGFAVKGNCLRRRHQLGMQLCAS